jgi:hypothetical protein
MATSRVNLASLALALVAGLVVLHDSQNLLASLAGLTLLLALFAFDQDSARTGLQSLAFALVCGLALLCTCSYPIKALVGSYTSLGGQDIIPPLFWLLGSAVFWFVDRSRAPSGQAQHVSLSGYSQAAAAPAQTAAPQPLYETRPFTPAPLVSAPQPEPFAAPAEPLYQASPAAPPPPPPVTAATAAAPVPPVLSGKEVSIYVTMMGEGMNVLRSVRAEHLGRDFYIIVDEMPSDENWEYVPGQVVRCKKKNLSNGKGLVAYEEAPRAQ